jgi:thiol-disulfide isomerase/thioredoxin
MRVPEICGTTPEGKRHCLSKNLGTRTVLFFWSLGCDHCEAMIPGLINLSKEYAEKGLKVFAFTLADDRDSLARTMERYGIEWINISDYDGLVSPVIDQFNISITPVLYLLDSEGVITDKPKTLPVLYSNLVIRYRNE